MAAIYMWHELYNIGQVSSTLYPIDSSENLDIATDFNEAYDWYWEIADCDIATQFTGGNLIVVLRFGAFEVYGGQLDITDTVFTGGNLQVVLRFGAFDAQDEELDITGTVFTGGDLTIVLGFIQFTAEHEELDITETIFTGGNLTPV